jgi:acyl carrier protein
MELNHFINRFGDCLSHTLPDAISGATKFRQLEEWSSIFALIVIAMIDSEYGRLLTADDIRKATTLEDLFHAIQSL